MQNDEGDPKRVEATTEPSESDQHYDVVIVGGGLSGSIAATLLGRQGVRVALVDLSPEPRNDFRVEKVAGDQVAHMARLGLLEAVARQSVYYGEVLSVRRGRPIDRDVSPHFGIPYQDLTLCMRKQIPASVKILIGRVNRVETSPNNQRVTLADGREVDCRLIVLATGMGDTLRRTLGIARRVLVERHSVTFGFDVMPGPAAGPPVPALSFYGSPADKLDYLSLFPIRRGLRGNLFTFLDFNDPWIRQFRQDPGPILLAAVPDLGRHLGAFTVPGKVENWIMDLATVENHRQAGVVLIGDAFQTSCPAAGVGLNRLLTDAEQLSRVHVPSWLSTPGMALEKINHFYDDPVKQGSDQRALRLAEYRRALTLNPTLGWGIRREGQFLLRKLTGPVKAQLRSRHAWMRPAG